MSVDDSIVLSPGGFGLDEAESNIFYCYSLSASQDLKVHANLENYLKVVWSPDLSQKCSYECFYNGIKQDVKLRVGDNWAMFDLAFLDEGLKLFAYAKSLRETSKFLADMKDYRNLLILPLIGVFKQKWCDGFCGHVIQGGIVCTMSPPGSFARVSISRQSFSYSPQLGCEWNIKELVHHFDGPEYLRLSLVAAIGKQIELPKKRPLSVALETFSLETAVGLLLLRQAFPVAKIQLLSLESFKNWHKSWKHLSNCLGMEAATKGEYHEALPSKELTRYMNLSRLNELAIHLNGASQIFAGLLGEVR